MILKVPEHKSLDVMSDLHYAGWTVDVSSGEGLHQGKVRVRVFPDGVYPKSHVTGEYGYGDTVSQAIYDAASRNENLTNAIINNLGAKAKAKVDEEGASVGQRYRGTVKVDVEFYVSPDEDADTVLSQLADDLVENEPDGVWLVVYDYGVEEMVDV